MIKLNNQREEEIYAYARKELLKEIEEKIDNQIVYFSHVDTTLNKAMVFYLKDLKNSILGVKK